MRTLPRRNVGDFAETMFLRPREPDDHRELNALLPWLTPLFVYEMNGDLWVRWSMPREVGLSMDLDRGCKCCGESLVVEGDNDDFHIDTAWKETDWWLTANEYAITPTEKEGNQS